ncbi:MAG: protein kinase [Planctomycetaceae bacterium]
MLVPEGEIVGEYRVLRSLGRGSSGTVVLAEHLPSHGKVALKIAADTVASREYRLLNRLSHPHIVRSLDYFASDRGGVIVLKHVPGLSVSEVLNAIHGVPRSGLSTRTAMSSVVQIAQKSTGADASACLSRLPSGDSFEQFAVRIVRDVAEALTHAHSRGVYHRDVKPENILIDDVGNAVLADFSVAGDLPDDPTFAGGTLSYMSAPQLLRLSGTGPQRPSGSDSVPSPAVTGDLYSLGIVLFELLTGELPYPVVETGSSVIAAAREALPTRQGAVQRVKCAAAVDGSLREIVASCLSAADENAAGYSSAAEVVDDLNCWLHGRALEHAGEPAISRLKRQCRRHRSLAGILLLTAMALLVTAGIDRHRTKQRLVDVSRSVRTLSDSDIVSATPDLTQKILAEGLLPDTTSLRHQRSRLIHAIAVANLQSGQSQTAADLLQRAILLNGDSAELWNDLGAARFRLKNFQQAIDAFSRAMTLQGESADVLSNRGAAFAARNDAENARRDFNAALRLDRNCRHAIRHLEMLDGAALGQPPSTDAEDSLPRQ